MIVDDGGDATLLIHKGTEVRDGRRRAAGRGRRDVGGVPESSSNCCATRSREPTSVTRGSRGHHVGVTEETTTGVHRLYEPPGGQAAVPGDQRQRLGHQKQVRQHYGCRHSLIDGLTAATDVLIGGKVAVVCGSATSARAASRRCAARALAWSVTEVDPICALQAAMDGLEVVTLEDVVGKADIVSPRPATRTSSRPTTWLR